MLEIVGTSSNVGPVHSWYQYKRRTKKKKYFKIFLLKGYFLLSNALIKIHRKKLVLATNSNIHIYIFAAWWY